MDLNKVISGLSSSGVLGGLAGGAVSGALLSNKKVRKHAGTALKVGGIAALGGLAWKAYQGYRDQQGNPGQAEAAPADLVAQRDDLRWRALPESGFAVEAADVAPESRAMLLVQAMIAAACADGHLDARERERILTRVDELGMAPDEKALVFDALRSPLSLSELGQRVDCPELAAEVYLASLLVVDEERTAARLYLDALAHRLRLPEGLVAQIHQQVDAAAELKVA